MKKKATEAAHTTQNTAQKTKTQSAGNAGLTVKMNLPASYRLWQEGSSV